MNTVVNKKIETRSWGLIPYAEAWERQEAIFSEIVSIKLSNRTSEHPVATPNYLILCEHPPVYTMGKSGKSTNALFNESDLEALGADFYQTNRGGDITFHGPGQIVGYPLLDLENFFTDIHLYLRRMEEAVIRVLDDYGIPAGRFPGYTGVWLDPDKPGRERKICAMGVRCSRWVTMHGWALNVNNSLNYFSHIVPCGIGDKQVTSMQNELGFNLDINEISGKLSEYFITQINLPLD